MRVLGIDYQRTLSVVCLREGASPPRPVGDGRRAVIPHAVAGDLWGSDAFAPGAAGCEWGGADLAGGPWLAGTAAPDFWRGLRRRLNAFLGGQDLVPSEWRIVLGLQADDLDAASAAVACLCRQAGLGDPSCLPAAQAVLARRLAEHDPWQPDEVVAVVAVGDTSVQVAAYRIRLDGRRPVIADAGRPAHLAETGAAYWVERVLRLVRDHLAEPPPPHEEFLLRQSAAELGARLAWAGPNRAVPWSGPLQERMVPRLVVTRGGCEEWPEVRRLVEWLPGAVRQAAEELAGRPAPDRVVLGGVGAAWPFAADALADLGARLLTGDSPEQDVARGAAWWPDLADVVRPTPALFAVSREPEGSAPASALPSGTDFDTDEIGAPPQAPPAEPGVPSRDEFERMLEKELAAGLAFPELPLPPDDPPASEP